MDGPKLLHGSQRVTTDATLRRDLEESLRATAQGGPIPNGELRVALAVLHAEVEHIRDQNSNIVDTLTLLVRSLNELSAAVLRACDLVTEERP